MLRRTLLLTSAKVPSPFDRSTSTFTSSYKRHTMFAPRGSNGLASTCKQCLKSSRSRPYSTQPNSPPPPPPMSGAAKLTTRRLISLHGPEAPKFLQGIITNNLRADSRSGFYSAFLTAPGKVLNDVFVYPTFGSRSKQEQRRPGLSRRSRRRRRGVPVQAYQETQAAREARVAFARRWRAGCVECVAGRRSLDGAFAGRERGWHDQFDGLSGAWVGAEDSCAFVELGEWRGG
jgi:hypothetical protein